MNQKLHKEKKASLRLMVYHRYFKSSGFYLFLFKNLMKLSGILLALILIYQTITNLIHIDIEEYFFSITNDLNHGLVWGIFAVSETLLGLIPPDLFIAWGKMSSYPWLTVTLLAFVSYGGGIAAYFIGHFLSLKPKIKNYFEIKHQKVSNFLRRWGGFFIVMAALFPIPYSTATLISGMVGYPFRHMLFFGLARILRFYVYAAVIFGLL
ncbi:MAG TPA: hypothetical protein PK990_05920 [Salinivirgaceae bacterium]|nr:hypothetical protein [Salinivirgaceae bacterium]